MKKAEVILENLMYSTRWILAPICFGLSIALLALTIKFYQELFHILPAIFNLPEAELILKLLSLIDMVLVGGLLVMVMFASYENFVSQMNIHSHREKLDWLGKMDSGSLKTKVSVSIVAISSIHLLRMFMDAQKIENDKLMWYVILHLTFVVSALVVTYMDNLGKKSKAKIKQINNSQDDES
ncbi:TIGR00645 family protein [Entomomonas asaccharolytica]|uniref:UPF0114 protein JHT90_10160 n=1 Tax=Entomomonas asaccharolytica TaxID=2785331 RepID=A0A974NE72_9GAMM|nr:TIGR00645 family protein [Entomomonas asaccharolytica]QQP84767.1 TIGR00645 family protein [Entomomonas asaccharolytica]